jgi:hypothetical protein
MLFNSPPFRCEGCGRTTKGREPNAPAAGDPSAWWLLDGPDVLITLDDGRSVARRGHGWACRRCGHTVPLSREHAR